MEPIVTAPRPPSVQGRSDTAIGRQLILVGSLPFAVGGILAAFGGGGQLPVTCVFRLATGLPCPLCGATRAFAAFMGGDPGFLTYNAIWVFVALALILAGLAVTFTRFSLQGFWSRTGRLPVYLVSGIMIAGWIWALLNRSTILT